MTAPELVMKSFSLAQAIQAIADHFERDLGVRAARAGGFGLESGTWIELDDLVRVGSDDRFADRLVGELWQQPVHSYDDPITNEVVVVFLYEGQGPVQATVAEDIAHSARPAPAFCIALVPFEGGVEARSCKVITPAA